MAGDIGRRRFLLALAGAAAGASSACRRSTATATAAAGREAPFIDSSELGTPKHVPDAEAYLVAVPERLRERALALLPSDVRRGIRRSGLLAVWERCPKDRFKLRYCESSRWFECPNCAPKFNRLGDKTGGPAPHGLNLFRIEVGADGEVSVLIKPMFTGLPVGTALADHPPAGVHCH